MNKSLFLALIFSPIFANGSMLNSSIFMTKQPVETVSKWSVEGIKNLIKNNNISCDQVKESIYCTVKNATEPLTTFAYENVVLATGTAVVIAIAAYQTGKYMNSIYYTPEEVKEIVTKQIDTTTRRYNPRAQ